MEPLKTINRLKNLKNAQVIRNLRGLQGVQAFTTVFLGLLTSFGIGLLANNSAYAASYINVSSGSGGTISFDSIRPSSAGVSASASDTLTITTNCSAGYSVYVSAQNGGDPNFTNTNPSVTSNNTIFASSTAVGSAATTLNSNTWGITGDSASASASKYVGLPAYANATDAALITVPSANTSGNNTNTIYYGVKVDTSLSPGTYTGDVLYTVLMNSACTSYALNFNDNGATTNNLDSKELEFDSKLNLADISSTSMIAKTGYTLIGWKDQNNNTYGITGEVDINPNDLDVVTLTAQWKINSHTVTINKGTNVTTVSGANTYTYDSTVTISATAFSTGYHFNNWTINSGGVTLYSNSTMTTKSTTSTPAYFKMPDADVTITANAAANTYTINFNGQGGTVTTSSISGTYGNNITTSEVSYSGYNLVGWSRTTHTAGQGSADYATTSTTSLSVSALASDANVANANGATINLYAVWESAYFQSTSCSGLTTGATTILADYRDNQEYTVYRWSDSGVAGADFPTDMPGYCIMTRDLSIGYITGGSITKGSDLTLTATDSAAAGTIINRASKKWSTTNSDSNLQYINGPNTTGDTYSAHSYYSYGAAQKVCPKGWRTLTLAEYGNIADFAGRNASGSSKLIDLPYSFIYGGSFSSSGWNSSIGKAGSYWSSTRYVGTTSSEGHYFHVNSDSPSTYHGNKNVGMSVRCISAP